MPSPLRSPATFRSTMIALATIAAPLQAQQPSAQTSVAISVRVQPTLAIHGVSGRPGERSSVIDVESNMPYRVSVRRAAAQLPSDARVLVRNAAGSFELLPAGASVTAVVSQTPGRRTHEILCRVETATGVSDAEPCALVYDLSAEYHDSLLRTTATDYGRR